MASLSKEVESSPIEIDSGAEEVNGRDAKRTTSIRTGAYKPVACGKTHKRQRKLTSIVWENFTSMEPDQEGNLCVNVRNVGKYIAVIASMGLGI